jgi:hypothetical protein
VDVPLSCYNLTRLARLAAESRRGDDMRARVVHFQVNRAAPERKRGQINSARLPLVGGQLQGLLVDFVYACYGQLHLAVISVYTRNPYTHPQFRYQNTQSDY